ncbi:DUF1972 domain-containing protein [Paraburkholderia caffeinilytica]|uniref:Glycosyl transferase n=1 Tax=Paraburkholderia caffeinilytica TaxID=1761016 RepID=A0ABQ1NBI6_9BURK|nr:DUF1972 domain-containing protein [Paraburkholderia caffeinilytica]GGC68017.1 hypothetical protein GCM10011400_64920 [Paraburkholderia caffeinilytica]CAB3804550.1 hypothetical protein LMG28690_06054 [Paraburkholderia caffeinilytica]
MKKLSILGIRGVPAAHGGFETFAEHLAIYLVSKGWEVTVYCQESRPGGEITEDYWEGIRRVIVPVKKSGAVGTVWFDFLSVRHLMKQPSGLVLTLGYNTAAFSIALRSRGFVNIINMDGLEWKRDKWKFYERAWLWLNERLGCWFGDHLIADHPKIADHLATRVSRKKITVIPYGAAEVVDADSDHLVNLKLTPKKFATIVARPEPENSILEIVRAFSRVPRGIKLVVLGNYRPSENPFHKQVMESASDEVIFPGAIYDKTVVEALRFFGRFYIHGHRVGGTNPSLVEALGAGSPVLAHDNHFNHWVAGEGAVFFKEEDDCSEQLDRLASDAEVLSELASGSINRFRTTFKWELILADYERLLEKWHP